VHSGNGELADAEEPLLEVLEFDEPSIVEDEREADEDRQGGKQANRHTENEPAEQLRRRLPRLNRKLGDHLELEVTLL